MEELAKLIEHEIERLKQSPHMALTEGWTSSPHYAEGYVAGQFAMLVELREAIKHLNQ